MSRRLRVFVACSGLGVIHRGYESFAREFFDAYKNDPALEITLFKGRGANGNGEKTVWCPPRSSFLARQLAGGVNRALQVKYVSRTAMLRTQAALGGKSARHTLVSGERQPDFGFTSYRVESRIFGMTMIPHVVRANPDVILFSDPDIGKSLWHLRRLTQQNFRLLFSNGAPVYPPFTKWDHVHQVTPEYYNKAVSMGEPAEKQSLLPYGFNIPGNFAPLPDQNKNELRRRLGLPENRPIVLSVGAVNSYHKRMDYLVQEVAALPAPRPFVLILGEQEAETPGVRALAEQRLGKDGYAIRTVPMQEVSSYYRAADVFVLASLNEGFGRAFVEALAHGLPCLAHDYDISRFVLGKEGRYGCFERPQALTALLKTVLADNNEEASQRLRRNRYAYERFSWDCLRDGYVDMLTTAMGTVPVVNH